MLKLLLDFTTSLVPHVESFDCPVSLFEEQRFVVDGGESSTPLDTVFTCCLFDVLNGLQGPFHIGRFALQEIIQRLNIKI